MADTVESPAEKLKVFISYARPMARRWRKTS